MYISTLLSLDEIFISILLDLFFIAPSFGALPRTSYHYRLKSSHRAVSIVPTIMWTFQALASVFAFAALALGSAIPSPIAASPSTAATPTTSIKHCPANLPLLYTPPPQAPPELGDQLSGDVTIGITNMLLQSPAVTITAVSDSGVLPPRTPVGGTFAATTNTVVPSGWAGAFTLDKAEDAMTP